MNLNDFAERIRNVKDKGRGQLYGACPVCEANEPKGHHLYFSSGTDGRILLDCKKGCTHAEICDALGIKIVDLFPPKIEVYTPEHREHIYCNEHGEPVAKKVIERKAGKKDKTCVWYRWNGEQWEKGLNGYKPPLYNLPAVISEPHSVYIVEGEKDAETLQKMGFVATSSPNGAGSRWNKEYNKPLAGKSIVILQDNDETGRKYAKETAEILLPDVKELKVIDPLKILSTLKDKGDITDIVESLGIESTKDRLLQVIEKTPARFILPPAQDFVESLSREDLLNPDKIRPVFELPAENRAAYLAAIEAKIRLEKLWNPWQQLSKALKKQQAEQDRAERAQDLPQWAYLDGFGQIRINEPVFIRLFTEKNALVCENGNVYGMDGLIEDRFIKQTIQREIAEHITTDLAAKTDKLLKALKNDRNGTLPPPQLDRLHLQNGTLMLTGRVLNPEKEFARNRLPVSYDHKAACPVWLKIVENLLEPEDRLTLQEYIGYLLVPTNRAQKALFICGKGGEGKSLIIKAVSDLLGNSCFSGKLQVVETRFGLAGLEGKLCFADDDIDSTAFRSTATLKEIITANKPVSIERKGIDPYMGQLYARFLCCGNSFASALYDNSDGFFRRQLLLLTRPGAQVQNPDRELADKLTAELPGILNWALDGLERLQQNGWNFTISARSRQALEDQRRNACNVISFLESNFVEYGKHLQVFAKDLYCAYCHWCSLNQEEPVKSRTFVSFIREHYSPDIQYSENIAIQKIRARGFKGLTYIDRWSTTSHA